MTRSVYFQEITYLLYKFLMILLNLLKAMLTLAQEAITVFYCTGIKFH